MAQPLDYSLSMYGKGVSKCKFSHQQAFVMLFLNTAKSDIDILTFLVLFWWKRSVIREAKTQLLWPE